MFDGTMVVWLHGSAITPVCRDRFLVCARCVTAHLSMVDLRLEQLANVANFKVKCASSSCLRGLQSERV